MKTQHVKGYGTQKGEANLKDILTVFGLCFACIAVIAGTFWITGRNKNDVSETQISDYSPSEKDADAQNDSEQNENEEPPKYENGENKQNDPVTVSDAEQPVNEDAIYETEPVISAANNALVFCAPLKGTVIKGQSGTELFYSKTLEDWRLHDGIDISADIGATVCATADGVVEDAYKDARFGYTIVIEHSGGIKSVYSNLTGTKMVKIGKDIKSGDPIGMVGDSAICEALDNPHLHYEMIKDGSYINPLEYFSVD